MFAKKPSLVSGLKIERSGKEKESTFCKWEEKREWTPWISALISFDIWVSLEEKKISSEPQRNPEHCAVSLCLDRSELFEHLAASRAVSKDGELVCSAAFLFSSCAPHKATTPGWLPARTEPIRMSPEPVGLTWITDWDRLLQQGGRLSQVRTYVHKHPQPRLTRVRNESFTMGE